MECPTCQASHTTDLLDRPSIKAFFTSSTLNGFYKSKNWAPAQRDAEGNYYNYHLETEGVGGMKLDHGRRMWRELYDQVEKNVDTHVVCGLNDILELTRRNDDNRLSPDEQLQAKVNMFMGRVRSWYLAVLEHAARHRLPRQNKFSISTLPRTPQLYSLPGTKKKQNFRTYNDLLDAVNAAIDRFNVEARASTNEFIGGGAVVGLKNVGLKTNSRGKMAHDFKRWREDEISRMLHLVPDQQARVAMRVLKFFQLCTPNAGQYFVVPRPSPPPTIDQYPPPPAPEPASQPPTIVVTAEGDGNVAKSPVGSGTVNFDTALLDVTMEGETEAEGEAVNNALLDDDELADLNEAAEGDVAAMDEAIEAAIGDLDKHNH